MGGYLLFFFAGTEHQKGSPLILAPKKCTCWNHFHNFHALPKYCLFIYRWLGSWRFCHWVWSWCTDISSPWNLPHYDVTIIITQHCPSTSNSGLFTRKTCKWMEWFVLQCTQHLLFLQGRLLSKRMYSSTYLKGGSRYLRLLLFYDPQPNSCFWFH